MNRFNASISIYLCLTHRIWDLFYYEGSIVLFQLTLGMLKMKEPFLKDLENSAQIFNSLADIPGGIDDVDALFDISMEVGGVSASLHLRSSDKKALLLIFLSLFLLVAQ